MTKELLTIEFRYRVIDENDETRHMYKTITIGVFDTLEEGISEGNKCLGVLSERFKVKQDDRFMLNHLFGAPNRLVTNTCYPTKGIEYFAKITSLKFDDLADTVNEVFKASK